MSDAPPLAAPSSPPSSPPPPPSSSSSSSTPRASRWSRSLSKMDRFAASLSSSLRSSFSTPAPPPPPPPPVDALALSVADRRSSSSPASPPESFSCCGVNVEFPLPAACSLPFHGALLFLHDDAVEAFKAFGPSLQHVVVICPHSRPLYAPRTPNFKQLSLLNSPLPQLRAAPARADIPLPQSDRAGAAVVPLAARRLRAAGAAMRGTSVRFIQCTFVTCSTGAADAAIIGEPG
jgi:hypothetical protein